MRQTLKQRVFAKIRERIEMGLTTEEELLKMGRANVGRCQAFAGLVHDLTQYEPSIQHETVVRYIRLYKADLKKRQQVSQ